MVPSIVVPILMINIDDGSDKLMLMTILMMVLTMMHLIDRSIRSFNDGVNANDNIDDGSEKLMPMIILMMVLTLMHLIDLSIRSFNDGVNTNDNIDDGADNDAFD